MLAGSYPSQRILSESTHHRLIEVVKTALIKIFVSPYATVCELYCGKVADEDKWDDAQIGHYIGIGTTTAALVQFSFLNFNDFFPFVGFSKVFNVLLY